MENSLDWWEWRSWVECGLHHWGKCREHFQRCAHAIFNGARLRISVENLWRGPSRQCCLPVMLSAPSEVLHILWCCCSSRYCCLERMCHACLQLVAADLECCCRGKLCEIWMMLLNHLWTPPCLPLCPWKENGKSGIFRDSFSPFCIPAHPCVLFYFSHICMVSVRVDKKQCAEFRELSGVRYLHHIPQVWEMSTVFYWAKFHLEYAGLSSVHPCLLVHRLWYEFVRDTEHSPVSVEKAKTFVSVQLALKNWIMLTENI